LSQADVILTFGASFNHWTTRHGALIAPGATVVQIDIEPTAIGRHHRPRMAIAADAKETATAITNELDTRGHGSTGFRTPELARQIQSRRWQHEPYQDASTDEFIDPRTLTIALDKVLPENRAVAVDSGHFLGYPSMYLDVPDARAWVFPNGFQAV